MTVSAAKAEAAALAVLGRRLKIDRFAARGREGAVFRRFAHEELPFVVLEHLSDEAREPKKRDHVRNHHDAVEEVGKLPDEAHMEEGAEHEEAEDEHAVARHPAKPQEVLDVLFSEEVPADNRCEGEEEEADRNEARTDRAEAVREGLLREGRCLSSTRRPNP